MPTLTVHIDRAEKLVNRDIIGKSDPYVHATVQEEMVILDINGVSGNEAQAVREWFDYETNVINDNLDPVWNEQFSVALPSLVNKELLLHLWDEDPYKFDDPLGNCTVSLNDYDFIANPSIEFREKIHHLNGTLFFKLKVDMSDEEKEQHTKDLAESIAKNEDLEKRVAEIKKKREEAKKRQRTKTTEKHREIRRRRRRRERRNR